MYYETSILAVRHSIHSKDPRVTAQESDLKKKGLAPLEHLLWMCDQIETFDIKDIKAAAKAGRWIGWIFAYMEQYGLFENDKIQIISREDNKKNLDVPH